MLSGTTSDELKPDFLVKWLLSPPSPSAAPRLTIADLPSHCPPFSKNTQIRIISIQINSRELETLVRSFGFIFKRTIPVTPILTTRQKKFRQHSLLLLFAERGRVFHPI